jgi:hypothetical protein
MDEHFFDDIAKGLGNGSVSRGRALKLVGGAALGAVLIPLLPNQAEALTRKFRRACRSQGGVPLDKGNCHCAMTCTTSPSISCHNDNSCTCQETVTSKGFCAHSVSADVYGCSTNADCPPGTVCLLPRGCPTTISCKSSATCPSNYACIKGICQETFCLPPCPT